MSSSLQDKMLSSLKTQTHLSNAEHSMIPLQPEQTQFIFKALQANRADARGRLIGELPDYFICSHSSLSEP